MNCISPADIAQMMKEARFDPSLMEKEGKTYKLNYAAFQYEMVSKLFTGEDLSLEERQNIKDELESSVGQGKIIESEDGTVSVEMQNSRALAYYFNQRISGIAHVESDSNPLISDDIDAFVSQSLAMYEIFNSIKTEEDIINNNGKSGQTDMYYDSETNMPHIPLAKLASTIGRKVVLGKGRAFSDLQKADGSNIKANELYHQIGMTLINQLQAAGLVNLKEAKVVSNRYVSEAGTPLIHHKTKDKSITTECLVLAPENNTTEFVHALLSNGTPPRGGSTEALSQIFDAGKYLSRLTSPATFRQFATSGLEADSTTEHDIRVGSQSEDMASLYRNTEMQTDSIFNGVLEFISQRLNDAIVSKDGKSFEAVMNDIRVSDPALAKLLGITDESATNLGFEESARGKEVSKLEAILNSILQKAHETNHYSKWKWTTNGRLHDVTAVMNKQTDKFFARSVTHTGEHTIQEGTEGYTHFLEGIKDSTGFLAEELLDPKTDLGKKILADIARMDKYTGEDSSPVDGFDFMKYLAGSIEVKGAKESVTPDWAGSPWKYATTLKALKALHERSEDGSFRTTLMTDPDAVTSGITIALLQAVGKYSAVNEDGSNAILDAFNELGMVKGTFEMDEKGVKKDFYWLLTNKIEESTSNKAADDLATLEDGPAFIEIGELIESGLIPIREMSKHATMPVSYSQGKSSATQSIAKALMTDVFDNLPLINDSDLHYKNALSDDVAAKQEYVKNLLLDVMQSNAFKAINSERVGPKEDPDVYTKLATEYTELLEAATTPEKLNEALRDIIRGDSHTTATEASTARKQAAQFFARRVLKSSVSAYYAKHVTTHLYDFIDTAVINPLLSKYKQDIGNVFRTTVSQLGVTPRILPPQVKLALTTDSNGNYESFGDGMSEASPIVLSDTEYMASLHARLAEQQEIIDGAEHGYTEEDIATATKAYAGIAKRINSPLSFNARLLNKYGIAFEKLKEEFIQDATIGDRINSVKDINEPSVHVIIQHMIDNQTLLTAAQRTKQEMGSFKAYPVHDSNIADANTNAVYTRHYSAALIDINTEYDPMTALLDSMEVEHEIATMNGNIDQEALDKSRVYLDKKRADFDAKSADKRDHLATFTRDDNRQMFGFKRLENEKPDIPRKDDTEKPTDPTGDKKTKKESKSKPEPKKETQEAPKESSTDTSTVEGITSRLQELHAEVLATTGGKRKLVNPQPILRFLNKNLKHVDAATAMEITNLGRDYQNLTNETFLDMEDVANSSAPVTSSFKEYALGIVNDVRNKFPDVKVEMNKEMALDIILASTTKTPVARGLFSPSANTVYLPDFSSLTEDNIEVQNIMKQENLTYAEFKALADQITNSQQTYQTMAHEFAHAATVNWMKANPNSDEVQTIREAMEILKKDKEKFNKYVKEHAFKDEFEFIAEAMANPDIYEDLQNFSSKSVNGIGARLLNGIKKIIDAIFGTRLAKTLRDDLDAIYNKISDTKTQYDPAQWQNGQESLKDVTEATKTLLDDSWVKYLPKNDSTGILGLPNDAMFKGNKFIHDQLRIAIVGDGIGGVNIKERIADLHERMKNNMPYYNDISVRLKNVYMEYPSIAAMIHTSGMDGFGQQNAKDKLHSILYKAKKTRENVLNIVTEELKSHTQGFTAEDNIALEKQIKLLGIKHLAGTKGKISDSKFKALKEYLTNGTVTGNTLSSMNMKTDAATIGAVYTEMALESKEFTDANPKLMGSLDTYQGTSMALLDKHLDPFERDNNLLHHLGKTEFTKPVRLEPVLYSAFNRVDLENRGYTVLREPSLGEVGIIHSPYESATNSGLLEAHNSLDGIAVPNWIKETTTFATSTGKVNDRLMLTEEEKNTLGKADPIQTFAREVSNRMFRDDTAAIKTYLVSEGIKTSISTQSDVATLATDYAKGKDHAWIISLDRSIDFNGKNFPKELQSHYKPLTQFQKKELGITNSSENHYVRTDLAHWVVGDVNINPTSGHGKFIKKTYNFYKKAVQWKKIRLITQNPAKIAGDLASNYTLLATMGVPAKDIMVESANMYKAMGELQDLARQDVKNKLAGKDSNLVKDHKYGFMYEDGFIQSITNATIADSRETATGLQAGIDDAVSGLTQLSDGQKNLFGKAMDKAANLMIAPEYLFKYMGMGAGKLSGTQLEGGLKKLEERLNKIRTEEDGKAFIHEVIGSPDGTVTQIGTAAMIAGDAVPRAILYKHLRERGDKLNHEDAVAEVNKLYIDYRVPLPKEMQFLSDIGLIMFPAFLLRVQTSIYRLAKLKPASVLGMAVAEQVLDFNAVNIEENNLVNRMYDGQILNPDLYGSMSAESLYMNKIDSMPTMDMFDSSRSDFGSSAVEKVTEKATDG